MSRSEKKEYAFLYSIKVNPGHYSGFCTFGGCEGDHPKNIHSGFIAILGGKPRTTVLPMLPVRLRHAADHFAEHEHPIHLVFLDRVPCCIALVV